MPFRPLLFLLILLLLRPTLANDTVAVGSKRFTENYVVAEIFSQLLEDHGYEVQRRFGLGGTMVAFNALTKGEIDLYPDYTGTLAATVLKSSERDFDKINKALERSDLKMLSPLGFDNSYSVVMRKTQANRLSIKSLSDLKKYPDLVGAFSFEFQERLDGWPSLKKIYGLNNRIRGIEVPLTYEALRNSKVDFVEAYSTEPMVSKYGFIFLNDDKKFFPKYSAVAVVNKNIDEKLAEVLERLSGKLNNSQIINLNGLAVAGMPIPEVANNFLIKNQLISESSRKNYQRGINWAKLWSQTQTHMFLTLFAVLMAILVAVPLATLLAPHKKFAQPILGFVGILQTIPSIALLTFMIPFFGIGFLPAIVGLFVYSLLPILQNTYVAMTQIDPRLIMAARGIGLYPREVLFSVRLPLAFPTILAGIRTATILNIGTATLAAFIGAGGLGESIVSGLALNNTSLVLQGAIPAAILAIVMDGVFSLINRFFVKNI